MISGISGLALVAGLGIAGTATAGATPDPVQHVTAGSVFTLESGAYQSNPAGDPDGCAAFTFSAHTFSFGPDFIGTWSGGGQTIRLRFKGDSVVTGQWSAKLGRYQGHAQENGTIVAWVGLYPGAVTGCSPK